MSGLLGGVYAVPGTRFRIMSGGAVGFAIGPSIGMGFRPPAASAAGRRPAFQAGGAIRGEQRYAVPLRAAQRVPA